MIECRICGCNCDPGDLKEGVCDDCRTEKTAKEEQQDRLSKLNFMVRKGYYKQMRLEEMTG